MSQTNLTTDGSWSNWQIAPYLPRAAAVAAAAVSVMVLGSLQQLLSQVDKHHLRLITVYTYVHVLFIYIVRFEVTMHYKDEDCNS